MYGKKSTDVTLVNNESSVSFELGFIPSGLVKNLDDMIDLMENMKNTIKKFNSFEKVIKALKNLPEGKCKYAPEERDITKWVTGMLDDLAVNVGVELSKECCSSSPKTQLKIYGGISSDLFGVQCDSPRLPIGYGVFVGATFQIGSAFSLNMSGQTTCEAYKICFRESEVDLDFGGGLFGEFLDERIARADLKVIGRASVENFGLCYDFGAEGWKRFQLTFPKFCIAPRVVGEFQLFSFVKTSIEANVFKQQCWGR